MPLPDLRNLKLEPGILPEPAGQDQRLVLWLPGRLEGGYQPWERLASVPRSEITVADGWCSTPATLVLARQRQGGLFSKLFASKSAGQSWILPNGASAEQAGERRTDLLLVWSESEKITLDEGGIQSRWPQNQRITRIAANLYLVAGIASPESDNGAPLPPQGTPRAVAEQLLASARQAGDRRREITALTDLGVVYRRDNDIPRSLAVLEEALALARQLGDHASEGDVLCNLGLSALPAGQFQRAQQLFEQELAFARETANRYAEKTALEHVGLAWWNLRGLMQATPYYQQALTLARELGDHHHEAELLWHLAILHADLAQRDQALAWGQEAVKLFHDLRHSQADWFADHLRRYEIGAGLLETGLSAAGTPPGSEFVAAWTSPTTSAANAAGPSLLRMAFTAAKAMTRFVGSGMKTVPPAIYQKRLRTCATCEHHTGLRCRLCGCFTNVKAWLPHEACPINKWTAHS
jgi:tetratricopeptide (TPR) repeat protein